MQIDWITPNRTCKRENSKEVRVDTFKTGGKTKTAIYFYSDAQRKITHGNRIIVGMSVDGMFFREADSGYKLSKASHIICRSGDGFSMRSKKRSRRGRDQELSRTPLTTLTHGHMTTMLYNADWQEDRA